MIHSTKYIKNTPFLSYLIEFKIRAYYLIFSFFILLIIFFCYKEELLFLLIKPLLISKLNRFYFIYTNIFDILIIELSLSFFFSIIFILPFFLYELNAFFSLSFYFSEKKKFLQILYFFTFLFINIFLTNYFLLLPSIWEFFLAFELNNTNNLFQIFLENKLDDYLINIFQFFFFISLNCILLLILSIFHIFKNIKPNFLIKFRLVFYLIIFSLILIFGPPDTFSHILFFIPFFISYELLIYKIIFFFNFYKN